MHNDQMHDKDLLDFTASFSPEKKKDVLLGVDTKEVPKGLYPTIAALLCCDV